MVKSRINDCHGKRIPVIGRYDVSDLQRAMRVVLGRAHLRALREEAARPSLIGCDVKSSGAVIGL
jgi:hypothetical protein